MDTSAHIDVVAYALLATLTPLGFAATVAVIESGRLKAFAFAFGFVSAQLATCTVLVAVGTSFAPDRRDDHPAFRAALELCFGIALLAVAVSFRLRPESSARSTTGRGHASLDRLRRLHLATALVAGLLLGVGGPKRLVLTALAAASIAAASTDTAESTVLVAGYTIVATFLVWGPIVVFELFGERVLVTLRRVQPWLREHQRSAVFYPLVVLGVLAIVDALVELLR
jgi:hypothetical protein